MPVGFNPLLERTEVIVAGHPRSGNTWLNRLLSDLLDAPIQNAPGLEIVVSFATLGQGPYIVRKTHMTYPEFDERLGGRGYHGPCKVVFIQRDPRDVICSQIHYRSQQHTDEIIMATIEEKLDDADVRSSYEDWIREWLEADCVDYRTRYEWLHADPVGELHRMHCAITGNTLAEGIIRNIVLRQSFDRLKPAYPHSMWRGKVGTWKRYFKRRHAKRMDEILGAFMLDQGYIPDRDWWKAVPE